MGAERADGVALFDVYLDGGDEGRVVNACRNRVSGTARVSVARKPEVRTMFDRVDEVLDKRGIRMVAQQNRKAHRTERCRGRVRN